MASDFLLDTSSFKDAANDAKELAEKLEGLITDIDTTINNVFNNWSGLGRNEFQKKYKIFESQIGDIKNGLWDLYEDIVTAETSYLEADLEAAKFGNEITGASR